MDINAKKPYSLHTGTTERPSTLRFFTVKHTPYQTKSETILIPIKTRYSKCERGKISRPFLSAPQKIPEKQPKNTQIYHVVVHGLVLRLRC
jgi:hypothetical protein